MSVLRPNVRIMESLSNEILIHSENLRKQNIINMVSAKKKCLEKYVQRYLEESKCLLIVKYNREIYLLTATFLQLIQCETLNMNVFHVLI